MKLQQEGQQLLATHLRLQQQQQQDEALLNAAGQGSSLFGQHPLLGNTAATRAGLEQAAFFQNQQRNMLRAQAGLIQAGSDIHEMAGMKQLTQKETASPSMNRPTEEGSKKTYSYYDASQVPDPPSDDEEEGGPGGEGQGTEGGNHPRNSKGASVETFPQKLYRMIEEADKEESQEVVSFFPHGRAFSIHKPRKFIADFMPRYFSTSRMSSFQRQLNLYGFRRITEGRDKGGYFHEFFLKGRKGLCKKIKRKKTASSKAGSVSNNGATNAGVMQGFGAGMFGGYGQVAPGLRDAANLYQVQMLQAASGLNGPAGFGTGGLANTDPGVAAMGLNLMGTGALRSHFAAGFPGMDQATTSALLEQKQTELFLAQMQLQHKQQGQQQQGQQRGHDPTYG